MLVDREPAHLREFAAELQRACLQPPLCVAGRHKHSQLFLDLLDAGEATSGARAYRHTVLHPGQICLGCRQAAQSWRVLRSASGP